MHRLLRFSGCLGFVLVLALNTAPANAHYLWVQVEAANGTGRVANIYFEESPRAGDGHYLDHFLGKCDVWVRTLESPKPKSLKAVEVKREKLRWMQSQAPSDANLSVDAYGKFGVYAYGKTNVLLHYYARHLQVASHDAMHELGRAEQMQLDLVPHDIGKQLEATLLWKAEPQPDRMVFIRGPKGFRKNVKTDARGRVRIEPQAPGSYTFRSSIELPTPGSDGGDSYELIRHNITLQMQLPLGK